eukprot:6095977-Pyramimonas_sp.AAC.1
MGNLFQSWGRGPASPASRSWRAHRMLAPLSGTLHARVIIGDITVAAFACAPCAQFGIVKGNSC